MPNPGQEHGGDHEGKATEARLNRWECVVIKGFAILFLILFLSEKAIKEAGSIRRTWASEIRAPMADVVPDKADCSCSAAGMNACCRRGTAGTPGGCGGITLEQRH